MGSQMQTHVAKSDSNVVIEESTLEPASAVENDPRNSYSLHPQALEQTERTFEDTALPPPPYEETESQSNMPRESSTNSRSRRDSHSSETRQRRAGDTRRRDVNENAPSSSLRDRQPVPQVSRAILVLGTTGAGKSSFIAAASGLSVPIGHNLGPGTVKTKSWTYKRSDDSTVTLIDTPGLNDQTRPDSEILASIINYIRQQRLSITAVVYLHRITERKLTGSDLLSLRVLQAICGDHFLRNITLATSMWGQVPSQEINAAVQRELEFNMSPDFWGGMIKKGAEYLRWDETGATTAAKTAGEIIRLCESQTRDAPKLNIFLELEENSRLDDTTAYRILTEEARKRVERERREMLEEQQEEIRELQRQEAELQVIAAREQDDVRRGIENLERIERPSHHGLINSLNTMIRSPLQRRFSDVPDTGYGRDFVTREERERESERDRDYESDRGRWPERMSVRRIHLRPSRRYEFALVRRRR